MPVAASIIISRGYSIPAVAIKIGDTVANIVLTIFCFGIGETFTFAGSITTSTVKEISSLQGPLCGTRNSVSSRCAVADC
jgi:hypothetical protein